MSNRITPGGRSIFPAGRVGKAFRIGAYGLAAYVGFKVVMVALSLVTSIVTIGVIAAAIAGGIALLRRK